MKASVTRMKRSVIRDSGHSKPRISLRFIRATCLSKTKVTINAKHRKTLEAVFSTPVNGKIESLLIALGCK